MNADEAADLLAHAAGFDNRQPSLAAALAWASALPDVPLDADAKAAVAAYYTTPPQNPNERLWVLPHHVRTLRTKIRNKRLENFQYEPVDGETTAQYLARYRGQVAAVADGRATVTASGLQLEGAPHPRVQRELEARGWEGTRTVPETDDEPLSAQVRRRGPLGIPCPVAVCRAGVGSACKTGHATAKYPLGKPLAKPHALRIRAAEGERQTTPEEREIEEQRIREASRRALERDRAKNAIHDAVIVDEEAS
ncbi:hypothetical protein [Streptomyces sp. NPDC047315]|uniref:zinc finger domain-containing protein n=1 Tax=Streptomyces sp. NPDC047315 TaxID=3155142 RepID=UPI0033F5C371